MRKFHWLLLSVFVVFLSLALSTPASADERGEGPLLNKPPAGGLTPEQIIQKFAAREKEFADARNDYSYRQMVDVKANQPDGPTGEFEETFDVLFDDHGNRVINMVYAPPSTIEQSGLGMTMEDYKDIEGLQPFVLTSDDLPEYAITYLGQQKEDELNTYVFEIQPKEIDKKIRRFKGRVWVDDRDFQIVKAYGKGISQANFDKKNPQEFPNFTTYREEIDGQYWFPTYTIAEDELHFPGGRNNPELDVHFHEVVRYTNYKRFRSSHKIIFQGQEVPPANQPQNPQSQPQ